MTVRVSTARTRTSGLKGHPQRPVSLPSKPGGHWSLICPGFGTTRAHQPVNAERKRTSSEVVAPPFQRISRRSLAVSERHQHLGASRSAGAAAARCANYQRTPSHGWWGACGKTSRPGSSATWGPSKSVCLASTYGRGRVRDAPDRAACGSTVSTGTVLRARLRPRFQEQACGTRFVPASPL